MAEATKGNATESGKSGTKAAGGAGESKTRNRKTYTHVMSVAEKAALQQCRLARNFLAACQEAIQDGKNVNPKIVAAASDICREAGSMLFD